MRSTGGNTGLAKVAVQCSADTFVVNQSLVLRINICGENRHLRQARKRYKNLNTLPNTKSDKLSFKTIYKRQIFRKEQKNLNGT